VKVGVEGTGSWSVGLSRFPTNAGVGVVEVDRPNRQQRRKVGKSDPLMRCLRLEQPYRVQPLSRLRVGMVGGRDASSAGSETFRSGTAHPVVEPAPASGVHRPRGDSGHVQKPLQDWAGV